MKYASKRLQEEADFLKWKAHSLKNDLVGKQGSQKRMRNQILSIAAFSAVLVTIVYLFYRGWHAKRTQTTDQINVGKSKSDDWVDDVLRSFLPRIGDFFLKRLDKR